MCYSRSYDLAGVEWGKRCGRIAVCFVMRRWDYASLMDARMAWIELRRIWVVSV